jgi:hypothetical protein
LQSSFAPAAEQARFASAFGVARRLARAHAQIVATAGGASVLKITLPLPLPAWDGPCRCRQEIGREYGRQYCVTL